MNAHEIETWVIEESDYGDELWFGGRDCGLITVNGWSNGGCKKDPMAWATLQKEALLIAAAPELLAALVLAKRALLTDTAEDRAIAAVEIAAALAKAGAA